MRADTDSIEVYVGEPVEIGAKVFMNLVLPILKEASAKLNPTPQQMGQLYAGFIGSVVGAMVADFGKEQAIAWAQQTIDMVAQGEFDDIAKPKRH